MHNYKYFDHDKMEKLNDNNTGTDLQSLEKSVNAYMKDNCTNDSGKHAIVIASDH